MELLKQVLIIRPNEETIRTDLITLRKELSYLRTNRIKSKREAIICKAIGLLKDTLRYVFKYGNAEIRDLK